MAKKPRPGKGDKARKVLNDTQTKCLKRKPDGTACMKKRGHWGKC
jgi:hypothetical protein